MLTKKERMEKLHSAGADTSKYFTLDLPEGIPAGAKIHIVIDENGVAKPMVVKETDAIMDQIISDGYVRNTKLHRRFVMAQMFHALNYKSYDGKYTGYNECLKRSYGYDYTFKMMLEEVRVLSKLEVKDAETFVERSHFFTKGTIMCVMADYIDNLHAYVDKLPNKKCKGVPYKRIKGTNIFNEDLDKKLYAPLRADVDKIQYVRTYDDVYKVLAGFIKKMIKLPYDTPKSKAWIDAYKGSGAFYTMKNLLMFHNCFVENDNGVKLYGTNAVDFISSKLDEYQDEYYRMFALMKKVIADNNFDFKARMAEIYS